MHKFFIFLNSFFKVVMYSSLSLSILIKCNKLPSSTSEHTPFYQAIPEDRHPSWSPDGDYIVYQHIPIDKDDSYVGGIYIYNLINNSKKLLIKSPAYNPSWSPSGDKILFRISDIYAIDTTGNNMRQLTNIGNCIFPSWSNSGLNIVFDTSFNNELGYYLIWIINSDGSNLRNISKKVIGEMRSPHWSSDDKFIVYSGRHPDAKTESQLWKIDTSGSVITQLTNNGFTTNRYPKFSNNGKYIAWSVSKSPIPHEEIWVMNSDGTNPHFLANGSQPSWHPNSNSIVFTNISKTGKKIVLWTINLNTGSLKQITF